MRTRRRDLPSTRLFPSLVRPVLFGGAEREVLIPAVGLSAILVLAFRPNVVTPLLVLLIVTQVLPALRRTARRDPLFFKLLRRHLHRAGFYPARGRHDAPRRREVPTL